MGVLIPMVFLMAMCLSTLGALVAVNRGRGIHFNLNTGMNLVNQHDSSSDEEDGDDLTR